MHDYDHTYTETPDYFGETSRLLTDHIELIPEGARVLDIGVGQGRNALPLAQRGCKVVGIDPSAKALEQTSALAAQAGAELELHQCGVLDFAPEGHFDAVLCFGLMQIMPRGECASLVHRILQWTRHGSVMMLSAWHVDDPSYDRISDEWERVALHSFRSPAGEYRTYLARGVIRNLFRGWKTIHHHEGMGPMHSHGGGDEHQHGDIELVAVRQGDD